MTAGPVGGRPDGRSLARAAARLAPLAPRAVWVGTLDLHHLDAPVRIGRPFRLDPFLRLLLDAVAAAGPAPPERLDARLGCGPALLGRWLHDLAEAGLVHADAGLWRVTPRGEQARSAGAYAHPTPERRRFTFAVGPGGAAHFLPWTAAPGPHDPALGAAELRWLTDAVAQPVEWKRRFDFPPEVESVEAPTAGLAPAAAWRRVTVASAERVPVVLALIGTPPRLVGYVPAADGDLPAAPALALAEGWAESFPELSAEPTEPAEDVGDGWRLLGTGRLRRAEEDGLGATTGERIG